MNKNTNFLQLWLEAGVDLDARKIYIDGEIDEEKNAMRIRAVMLMLEISRTKPIHVIISSFGGSAYDSFGMYDVLTNCSCPIYTYAHSKVMSGGFIIYLAGIKRYALPSTTFMMHSISSGMVEGKSFEQEIDVMESKRLNKVIMEMLATRTKMDKKWWYRKIKITDLYLDFTLALQYGIVTEDNKVKKINVKKKKKTSKRKKVQRRKT